MASPLVSVIIPTFNRKALVLKAARSVLDQTYRHIELIIIDDGSTDGTDQSFLTLQDQRMQYIKLKRSGVSAARNKGVLISKGEYIAFLDSDDLWHKEKLQQQVAFHQTHPHFSISQTQEVWIRNGRRVNPKYKHKKPAGYIFPESLHLCTVTPSSVFMTKTLFNANNGFDEKMPACEDYDLWLRISANHDIGLIDDLLLTKYGGHKDQLSQLHPAMDRFRIYSLGKILLSNKLSDLQQELAQTVFRQKLEILLKGILKRHPDNKEFKTIMENLSGLQCSLDEFQNQSDGFLLNDHYYS